MSPMSKPTRALITQFWPKNLPLLERYLNAAGPRVVITFRGFVVPELEDLLKCHGSELLVLDSLLEGGLAAAREEFEKRIPAAFSSAVEQGMQRELDAAGGSWQQLAEPLWDVTAATLPTAFALVEALDRLAASYEIELVAVNEDWMFASKTCVAWAKARGIPSLHLEHNPTLCYPYTVHDQQNSEQMVVWSEDSRQLYGDAGFAAERLHVLGLPQFDQLLEQRGERARMRASLCLELGLQPDRPLVVLGTTLVSEHWLPPELSLDEQVLRAYLQTIRELGHEVQVIIKGRRPQGRFGIEQVQALAADYALAQDAFRYADGDPLPFLLAADVVVAVESGLQVEALLVGTPVLNLMTETGFFYGPGLVPAQGVDTVAANDLVNAIRRLLFDEAHRQTMLARGTAFVAGLPVDSTSQVAQLMQRLALAEPQRLVMGDRLETWLESGTPRGRVLARILEDLDRQQPRPPRLATLVLDRGAGMPALQATLASLEANLYPYRLTLVVSALAAPAHATVEWLCVPEAEQLSAINTWAAAASADWLQLVDAGVEFTPGGLLAVARTLATRPDCRALYADEFQRSASGVRGACFKPDFNLDLLLGFPLSLSQRWFFKREIFLAAGGFDPVFVGAAELDLILRLVEQEGLVGLEHLDEVLLTAAAPSLQFNPHEQVALERHLQARGFQAEVQLTLPGRYRIDYGHPERPKVSIVVAVRDHLDAIQRLLDSLLAQTRYPCYEILLVDCESQDAATQQWLQGIEELQSEEVKVWRFAGPFNYSALVNAVAQAIESPYLLLLAQDAEIIQPEWLDELVNQAQRPEVGAVGGKILDRHETVEQAGLVLGLDQVAGRVFAGEPAPSTGYLNRLQVTQNYSALGKACLLLRREAYLAVGGLDEAQLTSFHGEVDLCLRLRAAGWLNVWTPHSLIRREGVELAVLALEEADRQARLDAERDEMQRRWLPLLAKDPSYNRHLSLEGTGFTFGYGGRRVQDPALPQIFVCPADEAGCGHYRIRQPLVALREAGLVEGQVCNQHPDPLELERFDVETLVLQRQLTDDQRESLQRLRTLSRTFMVSELDDYLPNLPLKSIYRASIPKDILKALRQSVSLCHRLVVSTPALGAALAGMNEDIRVVPNFLPPRWWAGRQSQRRQGRKPRVGWGGGISHTGDLELVADVVMALADEVEWVFFGMCPERLRPFVHEFHAGVPIERYPAKLASLNLDLAIAPLEDNLFNRCKTNLRLLEYGACGFPVICSDLEPYQGDLPVIRVRNRFKDWCDAIGGQLADLDATARQGDLLRQQVLGQWMLEGENLLAWRAAWLPD